MKLRSLVTEARVLVKGMSATQLSLLHNLYYTTNGAGTFDSRQRAALDALAKRGFVTIVKELFPNQKKLVPSYTATITDAGRKAFEATTTEPTSEVS